MIVITNIEYFEADRDEVNYFLNDNNPYDHPMFFPTKGTPVDRQFLEKEFIRGRRFRRPSDGTDIVVGLTVKCQGVLGLTYEAWENLSSEIDGLSKHNNALTRQNELLKSEMYGYKSRVDEMADMSFWRRLKWAVTHK